MIYEIGHNDGLHIKYPIISSHSARSVWAKTTDKVFMCLESKVFGNQLSSTNKNIRQAKTCQNQGAIKKNGTMKTNGAIKQYGCPICLLHLRILFFMASVPCIFLIALYCFYGGPNPPPRRTIRAGRWPPQGVRRNIVFF